MKGEAVINAWSLREVYFDEDGNPSMHRSLSQRPWVGLTDKEYDEIWRMDLNNKELMDKTIAKLKDKNNGT